jgi:cellulose synthase/poly-beta-1,6-N-acetylglucosamine synthase-like glycosyltransferase
MRRPVHIPAERALEAGIVGQVAVITLTVPGSEALHIVERQLRAMTAMNQPHDSWILVDKEHSPEIEQMARGLGVNYFSRHDTAKWGEQRVDAWNQPEAPFAAKTKAGNVNSWLDAHGWAYTHFTQLDVDHNPIPEFLDRVLGYFVDERVAWVQAPSLYGNGEYWTSRGASEQERVLQGPLQMGFYGFSRTPFIIGSHCTYDTEAVFSIGGFQPTRAEDHLDTVCLAAAGFQGVYVPEEIAVGDGPEDIDTYLTQQFAWAHSMIQVLLNYTPKLVRNYTPRQALQFLFVQTWYTFWCMSLFTLFSIPLICLLFNTTIIDVSYFEFLSHSIPVSVTATLVWLWSRSWHMRRHPRLSWRGVALHVSRWVVVLNAFVQVLLRVKKPYMITIKGVRSGMTRPLRFTLLLPYMVLVGVSLAASWSYLTLYGGGSSQGYLFFALQGSVIFLLLLITLLARDMVSLREDGVSLAGYLGLRSASLVTVAALTLFFVLTAVASYSRIVQALLMT